MNRRGFLTLAGIAITSLFLPSFLKRQKRVFEGTILRFGVFDDTKECFALGAGVTINEVLPVVISNDMSKIIGYADLRRFENDIKATITLNENIDPEVFKKGYCSVSGKAAKVRAEHFERWEWKCIDECTITHLSWPEKNSDSGILPMKDWKIS